MMKKIVLFVSAFLCLCLALVGCTSDTPPADNPTTTTTTTAATTTTTDASPYITEEAVIEIAEEYFKIENESYDSQTGNQFYYWVAEKPTEENPCYKVELQWTVQLDGQFSHLSTLDFVLIDAVSGQVLTET